MSFVRSYLSLEAVGRIGRDAVVRTTSTGKSFTAFSIAVTERNCKDGADRTQWFDVSYFGSVDPRFVDMLKAGAMVFVRGELSVKAAVADNQPRVYTGIRAREVVMLAGVKREQDADKSAAPKQAATPLEDATPAGADGVEDVPF